MDDRRAGGVHHAHIALGGREYALEYQAIAPERTRAPLLVFLHEGLGSLAMWRDWPRQLCDAGGMRGLLYSRPGYGSSTPRPHGEKWTVDYMHAQAREVLPAFLEAIGVDSRNDPPWLIGHSDGASIALIHAAAFPKRLAGLVVLAPHVFVENLSIESITRARETYVTTDTQDTGLRVKLARYHQDPDSAFWGWNDIWLDPDFRSWNIEALLQEITRPILAVQGEDDEYGTMAQLDSIAREVPHAQLLKLAACGHSPQRDQPQRVIQATLDLIAQHSQRRNSE